MLRPGAGAANGGAAAAAHRAPEPAGGPGAQERKRTLLPAHLPRRRRSRPWLRQSLCETAAGSAARRLAAGRGGDGKEGERSGAGPPQAGALDERRPGAQGGALSVPTSAPAAPPTARQGARGPACAVAPWPAQARRYPPASEPMAAPVLPSTAAPITGSPAAMEPSAAPSAAPPTAPAAVESAPDAWQGRRKGVWEESGAGLRAECLWPGRASRRRRLMWARFTSSPAGGLGAAPRGPSKSAGARARARP